MAKAPSALSKLNLPTKIGIGVLLVIMTGAVYFLVFHNDLQTSIDGALTQQKRLNADLVTAEAAKSAYQKDLADLGEGEQRQRELSKVLPETAEAPAFLSTIQGVANVAGVNLTAWTPQAEVPEQFYARIPMKLKLTGRYHQVARFFYQIGQVDRIINMENIAITDPKRVDNDVLLDVSVLATAFHLIDSTEAAAAPAEGGRRKK
jgi:type IV pilus assembly protein PilO